MNDERPTATTAAKPEIHGCRGCDRPKEGYRGYQFCELCPKLQR